MQDPNSTNPNQPGFLLSGYKPFDNAYRNSLPADARNLFDRIYGAPIGHMVAIDNKQLLNDQRYNELANKYGPVALPVAIFYYNEMPLAYFAALDGNTDPGRFTRHPSLIVPDGVVPFGPWGYDHSYGFTQDLDPDPEGIGTQRYPAPGDNFDLGSVVKVKCTSTVPVGYTPKPPTTTQPGDTISIPSGAPVVKTYVKVMAWGRNGTVHPVWECVAIDAVPVAVPAAAPAQTQAQVPAAPVPAFNPPPAPQAA